MDTNLIQKIQNDFAKSNPKIINNNDNTSTIKKTFSSKYTEDISDSDNDSDLTSYKNRNLGIVNQLKNKDAKINNNKVSQSKQKSSKNIQEEVEELIEKIDDKNNKKISKSIKSSKKEDSDSELPDPNENLDQDESDESDDEHQYEYTEEFKKKVKDFVKNDDRIRELQAELKVLNNAKKAAELEILKHLERLGESNINITGGKLRINQYESKEGLKEDLIKEALSEKIKDPKIIEFIFEKINEKRVANGKVQKSLKRTFERGGAKKEKK
jgi:hypothetical protein